MYSKQEGHEGTQKAKCGLCHTQDVEAAKAGDTYVAADKASTQLVVLQVELASKSQARIMQWVVWVLLLLLIVLAVLLFTNREDYLGDGTVPMFTDFYYVVTIIASVSLAALLGAAILFVLRVRRAAKQHRQWPKRQRALAMYAAVQLCLEVNICTFWLAPNAAVVASTCRWPAEAVAVLGLLRWSFFTLLLMWLLVMMHGMTRRQQSWDLRKGLNQQPGVLDGSTSDNKPETPAPSEARPECCVHLPAEGLEPAQRPQGMPPIVSANGTAGTTCAAGAAAGHGRAADMASEATEAAATEASCPPRVSAVCDQPSGDSLQGGVTSLSSPPALLPTAAPVPQRAEGLRGAAQGVEPAAAGAALRAGWRLASAIAHDLALQVPLLSPQPHPKQGDCGCFLEAGAPGCQLVIDGSWGEQARTHWPKLLMWGVLETASIMHYARQCTLNSRDVTSSFISAGLVLIYALLFYVYLYRAFKDHSSLPYSHYRLTNIYIRVQLRHASAALAAISLAMLIDLGTGVNSCTAYIDAQMGSLPMQIALVQMGLVSAFLYMPATTLGAPLLQSMLQQFSWTEADLPALRQRRNADLAAWLSERPTLEQRLLPALLPHLVPSAAEAGAGAEAALAREPVFCMERAVRLFYWAKLAYQYGNPLSIVSESTALRLFGLSQYKCVHEPSTNIRGLLGWGGSNTVVLCFRGTASMQNVWTDIRSHQVTHFPERWVQGQVVRVHAGFYSAWRKGGFRERVLEAVREVVDGGHTPSEDLSLYVTGHSLGGALAVLAAYELRSLLPAARLSVYTFGAPRVGGRAWYLDYSRAVPDTWGVINSQDPVPRIPKVGYKRCGERVTVNSKGDIIVRPSYFELSIINRSGGSLRRHLLWSYSLSLAAVVKAQFLPSKCLPGGESGVRGLVSALDVGEALLLDNMDLGALEDPAVHPRLKRVIRPQATRKSSGIVADCSCAPWLRGVLKQQEAQHVCEDEDEQGEGDENENENEENRMAEDDDEHF